MKKSWYKDRPVKRYFHNKFMKLDHGDVRMNSLNWGEKIVFLFVGILLIIVMPLFWGVRFLCIMIKQLVFDSLFSENDELKARHETERKKRTKPTARSSK